MMQEKNHSFFGRTWMRHTAISGPLSLNCIQHFFWPQFYTGKTLCNFWLTQHIGQMLSLFSSKFVDLRFCRWRPDTSSPWCSSSSPPSSLFAPVAQNTPAWPAPRSRRITFSQTYKKFPPGHDLNNHVISHMWWKTLQHPKQIKSDHAERLLCRKLRPPIVTSYQSTDILIKTYRRCCSAKIHTSPIIHEFEDLALRIRWNSSDWMYSSCSRLFFWAGSSSSPVEFSSVTADM